MEILDIGHWHVNDALAHSLGILGGMCHPQMSLIN